MATMNRYSVAKTMTSYDPRGVNSIVGSTVYSITEQYLGGVAYGEGSATPLSQGTTQLNPTSYTEPYPDAGGGGGGGGE